jgi:aryl-alcohol dehydrogenase-like predicted oxidoreductase
MRQRTLGATGTLVSELCLGAMTFGAETDETGAHAILDRYVEAGGTFVDTANVYSAGASEEIVGRWLAKRGSFDDLVIATKGRFPMPPHGPNDAGLSRPALRRALTASLRRLGLDSVDLYQVHSWDPVTPLEETLSTLDDLVREGLVRYVGISNFTGWQLQRATLLASFHGWAPPVTLQPQYSLVSREIEWELVPLCADEGIGLLPWSPLGGGWLTGKYRRDQRPTGETRLGEDPERGVEAYDRRGTERTWQIVDAVQRVAGEIGASPAQVALRWVTDRPTVSSTILGTRTVEQLEDNLGAADVALAPEQVAELDRVSAPPTPDYPYGFIAENDAARLRSLGG